jgi:hypothetical protein
MIIILGLVILVAAVVVGVAGVVTNHGSGHVVTHGFTVFGYHLNGSTGRLFLYGIVVGAVAVFGLGLLLTGAGRTSRRGRTARQGLERSRGETAAATKERDELASQRDAARAESTSVARNGSREANGHLENDPPRRSLLHPLGHGSPSAAATPADTATPVDR